MLKNRSFGIAAIAVGIFVNNFAYLWDVIRGIHAGFIYLGQNGIVVALVGVALILLGTYVLARSAPAGAAAEAV